MAAEQKEMARARKKKFIKPKRDPSLEDDPDDYKRVKVAGDTEDEEAAAEEEARMKRKLICSCCMFRAVTSTLYCCCHISYLVVH